jgi:hypothetical protein
MNWFCIFAGLILISSSVFALTDGGLVSWWKLDENTGTIYRDSNTLMDTNLLYQKGTMGVTGLLEKAYKGVTYAANTTTVDTNKRVSSLEFTGNFSINWWVKKNSTTDAWGPMNEARSAGYQGYRIFITGNKVQFMLGNVVCYASTSGSITNDGSWHMVTNIYNKTNGRYLTYLDGVIDMNQACTTTLTYSAINYFSLNGWMADTMQNWSSGGDMNIDEVSAWNRVLVAADVNTLYNNRVGVTYCSDGTFNTSCATAPPDPCAPTINTDWVIGTEIVCTNKKIDLGSGKLVVNTGGRLKLYDSNVTTTKLNLNGNGDFIYIFARSFLKVNS